MIKLKSVTLMAAALLIGFGGTAIADDLGPDVDGDVSSYDSGVPGIEADRVRGDRVGMPGVDVDLTTRIGGLDRDGDRMITRMEANTDADLDGQFTTLDRNRDGKLDNAEYSRFKADLSSDNETARRTDDGGVPGIDVDRVPGDRVGMPGIDVDITARVGKLDKNRDNFISRSEAKADAELSRDFSSLDNNSDGKLSEAEFARFETEIDTKR